MHKHTIHQQQHMLQQQQLPRTSWARRSTCVVSAAKRNFREANVARRAAAEQQEQQQQLRQTQQQQQQGVAAQPAAAAASKPHAKQQLTLQQSRSRTQNPAHNPTADGLGCIHFGPCSGCTLETGLWSPPILSKAQQFFASHGVEDFQVQQGPVHGWRCRAKLAVRGSAAEPRIGLFESGSHTLNSIPQCRAHHPRINEAVQLVQQVAAGLRVQPYQDFQQQQQQQRRGGARDPSSTSSSSSSSSGYLRYLQLTVLPSQAGGRAEEDAKAQVQLVIVWAAADSAHPSFSDAQRLAAALWAQGGPKTPNPLAALRARAEATATAAASSSSRKGSSKGSPNPKVRSLGAAGGSSSVAQQQQQQQQPLLHSIWVNFQPHPDVNRVLGDSWQLMHGPETGWQGFGGVQLAVQPGSFVQANYGAMQSCLAAIAAAVPKQCSVLELYAGSGVIGLSLCAAGVARRVVCVEINPLARQPFDLSLAQLAATDKEAATKVSHVTASAADADTLTHLLTQHYAAAAPAPAAADLPDVLIVDPPRKGLDPALMQLLTTPQKSSNSSSSSSSSSSMLGAVTRLVYLSCGFEALAADTDQLVAGGWRVEAARGFLFFPGTDTIETLAVFTRE